MNKKFDYQKQNRFMEELVKVYRRQNADFKKKVKEEDFVLAFTIIEINGQAQPPEPPEDFVLDPLIFAEVERTFEKVYQT